MGHAKVQILYYIKVTECIPS